MKEIFILCHEYKNHPLKFRESIWRNQCLEAENLLIAASRQGTHARKTNSVGTVVTEDLNIHDTLLHIKVIVSLTY
uniref:Uncharacterized protein n=1 Tax=Pararge aegeria TaxID=116150 RepID=S4NNT7_9NEOP